VPERAVAHKQPRSTQVSEIGTPRERLLVAHLEETMDQVLARMGARGLGRMPVVSHEAPHHLLGMLRRGDIIQAYNIALTRRGELQHRASRMKMRHEDETEFIELTLSEEDKAVGKLVKDVASQFPNDCILISIYRDGRTLVPHGNTEFKPGDHITAFIHQDVAEEVYQCLTGGSHSQQSLASPQQSDSV
jgi:CIC family chloride channel protein